VKIIPQQAYQALLIIKCQYINDKDQSIKTLVFKAIKPKHGVPVNCKQQTSQSKCQT